MSSFDFQSLTSQISIVRPKLEVCVTLLLAFLLSYQSYIESFLVLSLEALLYRDFNNY